MPSCAFSGVGTVCVPHARRRTTAQPGLPPSGWQVAHLDAEGGVTAADPDVTRGDEVYAPADA